MCGIFFTNKNINSFDIDYVLEFLKKRGPDNTNIKHINNYTFIHTLLSMTGLPTSQPFSSENNEIMCIFNGEIYNFENFGSYKSDGECLIPLYQKYDDDFINKLDGEFAIILVDFSKNKLIVSTDIFSTKPLWIGFDENNIGISSYKSCLNRIEIYDTFQILANTTYILNLYDVKILQKKRVHTFDLTQYKNNFDDWNKAFSESIKKRTKYAKCGIFIGMSGGYDSGAIACELTKQCIDFSAYSITNIEDMEIINNRTKIIKNVNTIELKKNDFLQAREYLKKNASEYQLNIDNGEINNYNDFIQQSNYNKTTAESLLKKIEFRKNGQMLTNDNGAIGCSYICSLAIQKNEKIYLSGSGADEIFSDYGFNKIKCYSHSTIGGYFPEDLSIIFPWKNFFGNTQRAYLMKEEHVTGAYGIEGRYPFLDKFVVQEFLWLSNDLKNKNYKAPLDNYLSINDFPYQKNQKIGFGCGFSKPDENGNNVNELSNIQKNQEKNKNVITNMRSDLIADFDKLLNKKTKSFESFYRINKNDITHEIKNCYKIKININHPGLKYWNISKFTLQENNKLLRAPVNNIELIKDEGHGLYCFWTQSTLYFSSSDNSNPITNDKEYSIIKLNSSLKKILCENGNKYYYIAIILKNCEYDTKEYFKIREILNYYNYIPNILICNNYEIFTDLPNIKFILYDNDDKDIYISQTKMIIYDINSINIDDIKINLFDVNKI